VGTGRGGAIRVAMNDWRGMWMDMDITELGWDDRIDKMHGYR